MDAIGPDDHMSLLHNGCSPWAMTTNARDALAVHDDLLHREAFPQLSPGLNGGLNEDMVKHLSSWIVTLGDAVARWGRAAESNGAEIEGQPGNRGTVRGDKLIQEAPAFEPCNTWLVDVVASGDVAGEGGLVHEQDPVALAGE